MPYSECSRRHERGFRGAESNRIATARRAGAMARADDGGARTRDALAKRRIAAMLAREIARDGDATRRDDATRRRCEDVCATYDGAHARARRRGRARERRDAQAAAGRLNVGACGASARGFATAEEIVAFATLGDDAIDDAGRRALTLGARGRLRRMHAEGETITGGAIAAEEAFEACERGGFWKTRWGDVAERAAARATRAVRRRFGATDGGGRARRRGTFDGDDGSSASEEIEALEVERADDVAIETVDGWLFREGVGGRGELDFSSDFSAEKSDSDGDDAPETERANGVVFRSKVSDDDSERSEFADERSDEDEDEDGETAFLQVEGAEIRDVEKDAEFMMREILAMQNESERVIAGKIQEKVERTKGAAASIEARRAKMLQSLLSKYSRVDTSKNSHTGAILRETTSSNPKYHFFRGTEPGKTRIEATNVDIRFRSIDAHVKAKKRDEEDRKERIAAMFRG